MKHNHEPAGIHTYLQEAFQPPPGYSAQRFHKMPERGHPPVGNRRAAAPGLQPGDPQEPGRGPEIHSK